MSNSNNLDVRRAFDEDLIAPVCVEKRRQGRRGWAPLAELHEQERADVQRLARLVPHDARNVHVAIEATTGRVGVFVVPARDRELDLKHGGAAPADPEECAQDSARLLGNKIASAMRAADDVIQKLSAGMELSYEDVFSNLPSEVAPESFRAALAQAHRQPMDVDIVGETRTLGGYGNVTREVTSREAVELTVDVRQINRDARPAGTVGLIVISAKDPGRKLPANLTPGRCFDAQLQTIDNQRALAVLHLPGACETTIRVKIGIRYVIATGKNEFVIQDVDGRDLVRKIRLIQANLEGFGGVGPDGGDTL